MARKKLGATPFTQYLTTASGVNVPTGVDGVWLTMIGAGGGGGSGMRGASATNRYGGEGGQGGNVVRDLYIPATLLGATFTATVSSSGGAGGGAQTVNTTAGNTGTKGGDTSFATGSFTWTASGGNGGLGGNTTVQTVHNSTAESIAAGPNYGQPGGFGGINTGGAGGTSGDAQAFGAAGGGGGGGVSSGNVVGGGGGGGNNLILNNTGGGTGGVSGGAAPTAGTTIPTGFVGAGAGGGAGVSGVGQSGASAVGFGGGGGGGGASLNANNSGAGGNGAPGYLRVVWDYRSDRKQFGVAPYNEYSGSTSSGAVNVPSGIKGCWVYMIGCGGAGGSGSTGTTLVTTYGGQGGYGGNITIRWVPAALLGATYTITIPANRTGGLGMATTSHAGNAGQAMAQSTFASGTFTLYCDGGQPGAAGSSVIGPTANMTVVTNTFDVQGGTGAGSMYTETPTNPSVFMGGMMNGYHIDNDANGWWDYGGPGGGGAGGYLVSNGIFVGSNGGYSRAYGQDGGAGGNGVAAANSGTTAVAMIPGAGAGAGASQNTANGQAGASATGYGGGGGGGGAAINGHTSGAGGAGGPGYTRVTWDYI